jgi:hypothetical protein
MAIREIPKSFEYECDLCLFPQKGAEYYTNSVPPQWARLGFFVGERPGSIALLLCPQCAAAMEAVITKMISELKL